MNGVHEMKARRQREFQRLVDGNRGMLAKVARTYFRSTDDQDDLVQEILVQLWRSFPKFDPSKRFSTWMYRVALNVAISAVRSASARVRHLDPQSGVVVDEVAAPRTHQNERATELYEMIDALEGFDRALLLLYLEEHTASEMGEILGITEANVATKISRLKQRLRRTASAESREK